MTLEELYALAEHENIEIDSFPMRELTSAAFPEGWIALDPNKITGPSHEKSIIAHELGHCCTGSFYNIHSKLDVIGKQEHKADVWATQRLIPYQTYKKAIKAGICELWELAEYFGVTYPFMKKAAQYWQERELQDEPD